jgi:hypothetical protein
LQEDEPVEGCFVWRITREHFELCARRDMQAHAAHAIVREMRQQNVRTLYETILKASYLCHSFPLLSSCGAGFVSKVFGADATPKVLASHDKVVTPHATGPQAAYGAHRGSLAAAGAAAASTLLQHAVYLLRGRVRIFLNARTEVTADGSEPRTLFGLKEPAEHLMYLCSCPTPAGKSVQDVAAQYRSFQDKVALLAPYVAAAAAAQPPESTRSTDHLGGEQPEYRCLGDIVAPALINFCPLLSDDPTSLAYRESVLVECVAGCDVLNVPLSVLREGGAEAEHAKSVSAMLAWGKHLHRHFIDIPPLTVLHAALVDPTIAFSFLSPSLWEHLPLRRQFFTEGEVLRFGAPMGDAEGVTIVHCCAFIVLSGQITGHTVDPAAPHTRLWPPLYHLVFGCDLLEAVAATNVDAVELDRADVLRTLCSALSKQELHTLCTAAGCQHTSSTGRKPRLQTSGLEPAVVERLRKTVGRLYDALLPVHVLPSGASSNPSSPTLSRGWSSLRSLRSFREEKLIALEASFSSAANLVSSSASFPDEIVSPTLEVHAPQDQREASPLRIPTPKRTRGRPRSSPRSPESTHRGAMLLSDLKPPPTGPTQKPFSRMGSALCLRQ